MLRQHGLLRGLSIDSFIPLREFNGEQISLSIIALLISKHIVLVGSWNDNDSN